VLVGSLLALATGCGAPPPVDYVYKPPEQTDDGLAAGTLDELGIDPDVLGRAVDEIGAGRWGEVHSLLLYVDGMLVFEEYFPGHDYQWDAPDFHGAWTDWDRDTPHNVHSVGKSLTSTCIGIAIDEGFIAGVLEPIATYLPDHGRLLTGGKEQITIEHLLTMTSGLEWDEWGTAYDSGENDAIALWLDCDDPIACILDKPLVHEPGSAFTYSGGNVVLLVEIVRNASGIDPPTWARYDNGVVDTNDQRLTPRAMVTIGATYLDGGVWHGRQVVPAGWVAASATPYPSATWTNHVLRPIPPDDNTWGKRGYGYGWWTHQFRKAGRTVPAFYAWGWGGQEIAVFPEQDAVAVFTGGRYAQASTPAKILGAHVIPALLSADRPSSRA
jgi:CubicO group peptidase (beta-lactamase class C family)